MEQDAERKGTCTATQAVHAGETRDNWGHALTAPISQTSTYAFEDSQAIEAFLADKTSRLDYGRYGSPTQAIAERKLAELEGAESALLFSTGMSAVTTALLGMLASGQHAVVVDDCYKKTVLFCKTVLRKFGVETTFVRAGDYAGMEGAIRDNTRLIFSESPTNPHMNVLDLDRLVGIARSRGVKVIIDSTFATPYNQRPVEFGVDLVIHSATKYLGGHNDLLAGVVAGAESLVSAVRDYRGTLGGTIDPHCAYLLIRGLKTFPLRMARQNETALALARFLEGHPKVRKVYYPGLASHPHHEVARAQMNGFGGVVSLDLDGDLKRTMAFLDRLRIPQIGASLGGVESLVLHPASLSFYDLSREERLEMGILDELVRYAVGVEDAEDLIADVAQALDAI